MPYARRVIKAPEFTIDQARISVLEKIPPELLVHNVPRQNVGAANPYTLAGVLMKPTQVIAWVPGISPSLTVSSGGTSSPESIVATKKKYSRSQMMLKGTAAFLNANIVPLSKILKTPYNNLFDPYWGSPLYSPAVISQARGEKPDPNVQKASPVPAGTPDHWGLPTNCMNWNTTMTRVSTIDDPIQGAVPNCYLHAAMIAMTFSQQYYNKFPSMDQYGTKVQIQMYDESTHQAWWSSPPVDTNNEIVLTANGKPVYTQSSPVTQWNVGGEIWPGIYEKAYAYFKGFPKSQIIKSDRYNSNGDPTIVLPDDYKDIDYYWTFQGGGGNPLNALVNLTNKSYTYGTSYFLTANQTEATIWSKIKGVCAMKPGGGTINGITTPPTVAWTYLSQTMAPDPTTVYQDEVIVANHAYAVLGAITSGGINYIVLRNPWGMLYGVDVTGNDPIPGQASDVSLKVADAWFTNTWGNSGFTRSMTYNDGLFALKVPMFKKYFQGYGWVV